MIHGLYLHTSLNALYILWCNNISLCYSSPQRFAKEYSFILMCAFVFWSHLQLVLSLVRFPLCTHVLSLTLDHFLFLYLIFAKSHSVLKVLSYLWPPQTFSQTYWIMTTFTEGNLSRYRHLCNAFFNHSTWIPLSISTVESYPIPFYDKETFQSGNFTYILLDLSVRHKGDNSETFVKQWKDGLLSKPMKLFS